MTIALEPQQLKEVKRILSNKVPGVAVWVFGSRATGRTKRFSDLDLALSAKGPLPKNIIWELKESFSESDLPFRVDIVDMASIPEDFKKAVEQTRVEL